MGVSSASSAFRGILIVSSLNEPCTSWVTRELDVLGAEYLLVNYEEVVLLRNWSVEIGRAGSSGLYSGLVAEPGSNRLLAPHSVWMRRWGYPVYPAAFDEMAAAFAFGEISSVTSALPELWPASRWINPQFSERRASNKIFQLQLANIVGFKTPRTLVSSDANSIREFWSETGRVIFKPVSAFQPMVRRLNAGAKAKYASEAELGFGAEKATNLIFTQELTDERADLLDSVRWAPAIFQQKIEKKTDIRVTVIGRDIFACRIYSQEREDTATDFRVMNLSGLLKHELFQLPHALEGMILDYMKQLDIVYGCFDFIEAADGEVYFLEVNPAGQWLWIEQVTGAPISKGLAKYLLEA